MKQYLTGFLSIVLAVVLFAFTNKQPVAKANSSTYFWYEYDAVNDQLGALLNPNSSIPIAKEAVATDCQDTDDVDCVRAFEENNRANEMHPPAGLDQIKKTE
ncbi:hypothetical protein ESA94_15805 [Lacibacter luteus]|uniref:Uncharacterized protein n=1 Tax=Lacibacter luteus TaxID=2508719 RepID=A0A4Q1CFQ1_9BACT|nr:hypothetical protein [Lacibacter luteus]RXK58852.1 hypothetical protein ESA94_15805 [Lacibacter luteus]